MNKRGWVLITGASSGIGCSLAKKFAEHSYNVVLVSRNFDRLSEVSRHLSEKYKVKTLVIASDLTLFDAYREIFNTVQKAEIPIEILVNNAGFGIHGEFVDTDLKSEQRP